MRFIIVLAAIALLYFILRKRYNKNPQQFTKKFAYWLAIFVISLLVLAAITGRLHWLYALVAGLVPLLGRAVSLIRFLPVLKSIRAAFGAAQNNGRPSQGQQSSVESHYFRMELNHDTGEISGVILQGEHQGKALSDLDLEQLKVLFKECLVQDPDSASLLAAYLDRKYETQWRDNDSGENSDENNDSYGSVMYEEMTRTQALDILGLKDPVEEKDIISAHRQLIQRFHPDRGGSNYLAAKINSAKDFLMES